MIYVDATVMMHFEIHCHLQLNQQELNIYICYHCETTSTINYYYMFVFYTRIICTYRLIHQWHYLNLPPIHLSRRITSGMSAERVLEAVLRDPTPKDVIKHQLLVK